MTATQRGNAALTVSKRPGLVEPTIKLSDPPRRGKRKLRAVGFNEGKYLYAHIRPDSRKRRTKTIRLGRVKGACGRLRTSVSAKRLRYGKRKTFRVWFDNKRKFSRKARLQEEFRIYPR